MNWSPEIKFFIEHRDEISAVIEINKLAQIRIPETVRTELESAINDDIRNKKWEGVKDARVQNDQVWWSHPKLYNENAEIGLFFRFSPINANILIEWNASLELVFYARNPNTIDHERIWNETIKALNNARNVLGASNKLSFHNSGSSAQQAFSFVTEPVSDILNIDALQNCDEMVRCAVERARKFTQMLVENLPSLPLLPSSR